MPRRCGTWSCTALAGTYASDRRSLAQVQILQAPLAGLLSLPAKRQREQCQSATDCKGDPQIELPWVRRLESLGGRLPLPIRNSQPNAHAEANGQSRSDPPHDSLYDRHTDLSVAICRKLTAPYVSRLTCHETRTTHHVVRGSW